MGSAFPRASRLLGGEQFKAVFDRVDARVSSREIVILARQNSVGRARLGLVVGRKNCRRAVDRNRFKRLVRESFRRHSAGLPACDMVVMARRGIAALDNRVLSNEIETLWQRLEKLCRPTQPDS